MGNHQRVYSNDGVAALALVVMGAVELASILFGQASFPISQAGEDGSFYVQIAHNMAVGRGITFDGIAPTTGVHWGWLSLLSLVFRIFPTDDPYTLFRIAGAFYFLLLVLAALYIRSRLAAVFLVAYLANRGHWDMETHFLFLTLAMTYWRPDASSGWLIVLARSDMVLWAAAFALISGRWRLAVGAFVGFATVCLINMIVDGNWISVSGQIKAAGGFNDIATIYRTMGHLAVYYFPVLELLGLGAVVYLWVGQCERILVSGFIASLALLAVHITRDSFVVGWYLAPLFLSSLLCTSALLQRLTASTATYGLTKVLSLQFSARPR